MSSQKSDRRWFLKMFPKVAAGAAVVTVAPGVITPPQSEAEFKSLSEQEQIEICNAAAICFGLKPRTERLTYKDISGLGA